MFTRIVRTGLSSTVSTPAIAAQWTMWVAPARELAHALGVEDVAVLERKFGCSASRRAAESASRWRLSIADDLVRVDEPPGERRPDEAGAARDEDPLALQSHAVESIGRATLRLMRATLAVAVAASLVVGCGSAASSSGAEQAEETSLGSRSGPRGTTRPGRPTSRSTWTLRCDPAGGTLDAAGRRCLPEAEGAEPAVRGRYART